MQPDRLRSLIDSAFNGNQSAFGRFIDKDPRSVRYWLAGDVPIPGYVEAIGRLVELLAENGIHFKVDQFPGNTKN